MTAFPPNPVENAVCIIEVKMECPVGHTSL